MSAGKTVLSWILCTVLFFSCKEKDLSDKEYIDFARNIERQINHENEILLTNAFDYDEFEKRVLAGLDLSRKEKEQASEFIRENMNPAKSLLELVINGADFHFVKFYRKDNKPHLIFRTYFHGGVSIEDWLLEVKDGEIIIYDAFEIISGIYWSDDYRQQLCNHLKLYTEEVININKLIDVNYLVSNDDYTLADSLLYWIMPQMQDNMYARTMELNLSSWNKSYEDMQTLASEFVKTFPDEKRIATFYLMQSSIYHGLADETINHIYTLIDLIGDDPVYYLHQTWAFQHANANQDALQTLDSAIRYMPHVFDLYLNKIDIYYSDCDYQQCVNLLYQVDSMFTSEEGDASFFKTSYPLLNEYKPFRQWLETKEKIKEKQTKIYNY
jgi:hypothetical protein